MRNRKKRAQYAIEDLEAFGRDVNLWFACGEKEEVHQSTSIQLHGDPGLPKCRSVRSEGVRLPNNIFQRPVIKLLRRMLSFVFFCSAAFRCIIKRREVEEQRFSQDETTSEWHKPIIFSDAICWLSNRVIPHCTSYHGSGLELLYTSTRAVRNTSLRMRYFRHRFTASTTPTWYSRLPQIVNQSW